MVGGACDGRSLGVMTMPVWTLLMSSGVHYNKWTSLVDCLLY